MLASAIVAVIVLMMPVGYVIMRKMSVTRQEIAFAAPQNGVQAIYIDIQEDTVRRLHILFADGSVGEVVTSRVS
jgi:prepilin-type processing-associated H-X9-DG protein